MVARVIERLGVVFGRLGLAGAILIAAFFLFGVLAGAVVVNRVQTASIGEVREQGEQDQKAEKDQKHEKDGEDKGESKPKHPNNGHGQKPKSPENSPDND